MNKIPTEDEVSSWGLKQTLEFGREGLRKHSNNGKELRIRRDLLITSPLGDQSPVLREVVMLSLRLNDLETVREVVGWLEEAGDPAMGYYTHKAQVDSDAKDRLDDLLESSAKCGFLPAKRMLSDRFANKFGPLKFAIRPILRLGHAIRVFKVARGNPNDIRLK